MNCGWVSASMNFLRYCIEDFRNTQMEQDEFEELKESFIEKCDPHSYRKDKTESSFRTI